MLQNVKKLFFALISLEIDNKNIDEEYLNLITEEVLIALYKLSKQHDLAHLIGEALEKNNLLPKNSKIEELFLKERNLAIYRYVQMSHEFVRICFALENAEISYIPLKGSVLRKLYKEPWLRTSCDIDILVQEENLETATNVLKKELNYTYKLDGNHDVHLYSQTGAHLELHYKLDSFKESWSNILNNVWDYSNNNLGYCYALTSEMIYFYHIAHMASHFKYGGCGIRPFIDLYLISKKMEYNEEVLKSLLKSGGLTNFNEVAIKTINCWFEGEEKTEKIELVEKYILYSGTYGSVQNRVAVEKNKRKSRLKFICSRIFVPYRTLKYQYPTLKKCPFLYPFYMLKRWFNLLKKENRKNALLELKEITKTNENQQQEIENLINYLGLNN